MLSHNSYTYILMGLNIRFLRNLDDKNTKVNIITALSRLNKALEMSGFEVTLASMKAETYTEMLDEVISLPNDDDLISELLAIKIDEVLSKIETVIFAEASTKQLYILPSRRYNTQYLLNKPEKLLAEGIFEKLDEIVQFDLQAACKCLLFGQSTAAAFHILRANEGVLKAYYYHHIKKNRIEKPTWGNMIQKLKAKTRNKPPTTLLDSLDLIRNAYRNPTQHPEATYDIDTAQDLFGVCLDVISKMGNEI